MDPLVTSALIQGGSDILGSLMGGGSKRGPSLQDQNDAAVSLDARMIESRMKRAEELGIHPNVMLGIGPMPGANFSIGGGDSGPSKAEKMSQMGQGISRAVHAWQTREERELGKVSAQLAVENQSLQNDRLRSEIALLHAPGSPPGMSLPSADPRYPDRKDLPLGADSASPRYLPLVNPDGSITNVTSPNAGDNEFLMAYDMLTKTLPDELKNAVRRDARDKKSKLNAFLDFITERHLKYMKGGK